MIVERLTRAEIQERFTHYARFAGVVPCYYNTETGLLIERNGVPSFVLAFMVWFYGLFITAVSLVDEDYEPGWAIQLRGEIC